MNNQNNNEIIKLNNAQLKIIKGILQRIDNQSY